jgi:hypothetical protein
MAKRSGKDRAAQKRAERRQRRKGRGGGGGESSEASSGGLMMGMRRGFKSAVHGKDGGERSGRRLGWLPVALVIVALVFLARRMGIF